MFPLSLSALQRLIPLDLTEFSLYIYIFQPVKPATISPPPRAPPFTWSRRKISPPFSPSCGENKCVIPPLHFPSETLARISVDYSVVWLRYGWRHHEPRKILLNFKIPLSRVHKACRRQPRPHYRIYEINISQLTSLHVILSFGIIWSLYYIARFLRQMMIFCFWGEGGRGLRLFIRVIFCNFNSCFVHWSKFLVPVNFDKSNIFVHTFKMNERRKGVVSCYKISAVHWWKK